MEEMLYMQVANSLMEKIYSGSLQAQEKLSERKLAAEYQVSRTVVREAVKLLNEKGLVYTVYGKGTFVNRVDDTLSIDKMQDTLNISHVEQEDVIEARELLEHAMIPMMIARVTPGDIEMLEELQQRMSDVIEDGDTFVLLDEKFHLVLSMCTHNRVLFIMTGTLNKMADRRKLLADGVKLRKEANKEHLNIINALKAGNEERLKEAVQIHINCIRSCIGGNIQ